MGIATSPLDMSHVVAMIDANEPAPAKRGPYKKREKIEKIQTDA
jgi:hypothetical protein